MSKGIIITVRAPETQQHHEKTALNSVLKL